jgi:predicted acylesterase/phospholipase RssA
MDADLGLALSGGGSRAAAFHRGTLRALDELGLVPRVRSVSAVSGGSVFAASWLAARARKQTDTEFLAWMHDILVRGFIRPSLLDWRVVSLLWRSRTKLLAGTFDRLLFDGIGFADLPATPRLCLNTTVLNTGGSGRFSQEGYSCAGVGEVVHGAYPFAKISGLTLGFATAASAAFPFGLPPLSIPQRRVDLVFAHRLAGHRKLVLTDGGILENLGIERLLQSDAFGARHILVSDAGARDTNWQPSILGRLKSAAIFGLSSDTLDRLLLIMNDKQNRNMRQLLFQTFVGESQQPARRALFVRLENDWAATVPTEHASTPALARAKELYAELGGDEGVETVNRVATGFSGLRADTLRALETHARWQVHALVAIYGAL